MRQQQVPGADQATPSDRRPEGPRRAAPRVASAGGLLIGVGICAAASGAAYLAWRWATPSECAWTDPDAASWLAAGVRPSVTGACALPAGTTVTGALVDGSTVGLLRGAAAPIVLALEPSGPLVLQRLLAAVPSLVFCVGFFGLALYAALRGRADRATAIALVFAGALLGSTVVTMVGLPAHEAFGGSARWVFMGLTQPLFLLAWGAGLAWLLGFPTPLGSSRSFGAQWLAALVGPLLLWTAAAVPLWGASESFTGWMHGSIVVQSALTVTAIGGCVLILVVRLRRTREAQPGSVARQQVLWVAGSAVVTGVVVLALWMLPQLLTGSALLPDELIGAPGLLFVGGLGIAMLRWRMFDLDVVLARSLVYAGMMLAAVLVCLLTTAVLAAGLGALSPSTAATIGAVLAALAVVPLRTRLERLVNRTLYGDRDDPYAALSRVAATVTDTGSASTGAVVGEAAEVIRRALRAPYVRITRLDQAAVSSGDERALLAGSVELPLAHAGDVRGALQVAVRGAGERYAPSERRLMADMARQLGTALHEQVLVAELQRSRERIVTAREEERRALRRALHDEAGPTMASVALRAETVRRLLDDGRGAHAADPVLAGISTDASSAAESLRRLAYDLRPPELDDQGLTVALTRYAATVAHPQVSVTADLGAGPALSAALEAAVYRIAVAAIRNAERHSNAQHCTVTLRRRADLIELTVADDGRGLPPQVSPGVGITTMRERAAELGGSCTVADGWPGTVVHAQIPVGGTP